MEGISRAGELGQEEGRGEAIGEGAGKRVGFGAAVEERVVRFDGGSEEGSEVEVPRMTE